jgi:hypothetical protein
VGGVRRPADDHGARRGERERLDQSGLPRPSRRRSTFVCKVSSYGSYFLFVEDHDRLFRCARLLDETRFAGMLADVWTVRGDRSGPIFTWYDRKMWAVFYDDVPRGESLPRVLSTEMDREPRP